MSLHRFRFRTERRSKNIAMSVGLLALVASPAFSQTLSIPQAVKDLQGNQAAPLPDVDAIERGESPPASVSFEKLGSKQKARQQAPAEETTGDPADSTINQSQSVRRSVPSAQGDDEGDTEEATQGPPREVPPTHQVKKGDTLWSVCNFYFQDPWKWPQLWALNPQVTNPHWIFDGDALRLKPEAGALATTTALDMTHKDSDTQTKSDGVVVLRETGFLAAADLVAAGVINGSREEKILLSSGDAAYLQFPKDKRLVAGERYTVFTVDKDAPIRDPKDSQKVVGYLVKIYGEIVLNQVADETSGRGTLLELTAPVERGYFVSKRVQPFRRIKPVASEVSVESLIVASFAPRGLLAEQDFVVLSRGSRDGLKVGNRSYVIRKGDGYRPRMERGPAFDEGFPKEIVAQLLVVDVHEGAAVAWVEKSTKEIQVGEHAETRRGY
jgi:LysM repeat protein